ncbi:MAG: four helix bundle protein [Chitinophagaceae bacterium]|nr:MAG: four helix bundle protein [Chitinophagaceae bacterium]
MTSAELKGRTKRFHIEIIKLCERLPKNAAGFELAKQLIRSAGSVAANYRAACRAKSKADFIYKLDVVIEEADESMYWLEIIGESGLCKVEETLPLVNEANELVSIFTAAAITSKAKYRTKE